jgi:hypothetical protein
MEPSWKELIIAIMSSKNPDQCPECRESGIKHKFVGDEITRVCFLAIWCESCNQGIHISRTRAPEDEEIIPFSMSSNGVIPMYKLIKNEFSNTLCYSI